jgi:HD-GYP domain-containing protein (c-di-GMP phosphodiesterase class II)
MRFSDLNCAKHGTAEPAKKAQAPLKPLDAPVADFPGTPAPAPIVEKPDLPAPSINPVLERVPAQMPPSPALSRKNQRREDDASARLVERPFKELDAQGREIYARNLSLAKELLGQIDLSHIEKYERIIRLADLNSQVLSENPVLLNYTSHATADNYLYAHSANVAILSQAMGLALGLERSVASLLGFCAMAHDIGMTDYTELAQKEGRFTEAEYSEVILHASAGASKLDRILDVDHRFKDRARRVILQVHERIDASGYPNRLMSEEIDLLAQIVGIADVYEAMSHPRPWRPAGHPHNVMKHLIDKEGKGFNSKVVKALIEVLSIYPPGSLVALTNGETAVVAKINRRSIARPVVSILLDSDFTPAPPRLVDLMEHPLTGIEHVVEDSELAARNPKFAARQELARWWVDW